MHELDFSFLFRVYNFSREKHFVELMGALNFIAIRNLFLVWRWLRPIINRSFL